MAYAENFAELKIAFQTIRLLFKNKLKRPIYETLEPADEATATERDTVRCSVVKRGSHI